MDNRGTPARINFQIQRYVAYKKIQNPSECWPFGAICEYSRIMDLSCRVPLSNRRASTTRRNTEAGNVVDENNRATPIVISSGSEDDSDDDAGNIGKDSAFNPVTELANVSHCPNEGAQVEDRKGKRVASASKAEPKRKGKPAALAIPSGLVIKEQENGKFVEEESESETDSEDDAAIKYRRQFAFQESLNTQNVEAPESSTRREAENVVDENNIGAEYDIDLNVAILESLNTHALRRGNIGNDSTSNPAMELANVSPFPNEDSVDEGAQVEALEADIGKFINSSNDSDDSGRIISNIEPTESMPRPPVSSRGRPLKPTLKLLELSNATGAPLPSKRKSKDCASIDRQTKQKAVKPTPAVPRFNEGDITLNRRPRGFLRRQGVAEPSGSRSVVGQASLANGIARQPDVVDLNVDVSEPLSEPMVCVTNQNPMDLTIEEAVKYLRSENRVSATRKVKLFGSYIS